MGTDFLKLNEDLPPWARDWLLNKFLKNSEGIWPMFGKGIGICMSGTGWNGAPWWFNGGWFMCCMLTWKGGGWPGGGIGKPWGGGWPGGLWGIPGPVNGKGGLLMEPGWGGWEGLGEEDIILPACISSGLLPNCGPPWNWPAGGDALL